MKSDFIARVGEPLATMAGSDAKACSASNASERKRVTRGMAADLLFLEAPSRLNGIEVVRIGRKVDHADAPSFAQRNDALVVMCREVVQDQDVAGLELGKKLASQATKRSLLVLANIVERTTQPLSRKAPRRVRFLPQFIGVRSTSSQPS